MSDQIKRELDRLNKDYLNEFSDREIVLGEGSTSSSVIVTGEAPGKDEVKLGRPFVGAAGKNLNEFIEVIKVKREDIYITNAIKYRLGKLNEKTGRIVNRPATRLDVTENRPWLHREIALLQPQIVVTLGNVPLKAVTNDFAISIGDVHGRLITARIEGIERNVFPLYHPASIIYNRALKEVYLQDMDRLKQELSNLIK